MTACDCDGFAKHRTTIGENAFVGSNASLVAPVALGSGGPYVGSGSVIVRDVPADAMAVARGEQTVRDGGASRYRESRAPKRGEEIT